MNVVCNRFHSHESSIRIMIDYFAVYQVEKPDQGGSRVTSELEGEGRCVLRLKGYDDDRSSYDQGFT